MPKAIRISKLFQAKTMLAATLALFSIVSFFPGTAAAGRTFSHQARSAVAGWLAVHANPLGEELGSRTVGQVETYSEEGTPLYHVVYLRDREGRRGFVIVPAEDRIEPIIGFFPQARAYDPSPDNPVGALVHSDLRNRMERAAGRTRDPSGPSSSRRAASDHLEKWQYLASAGDGQLFSRDTSISDVRVAPLIQSKWSQGPVDGDPCYNYYTPENYVCGCTATAAAQLMRYHQHPSEGVGTPSFEIEVDGSPEMRNLRGGDGSGSPYEWADMALVPDGSITLDQREAIGALTHDAGVAIHTSYYSGGSGASFYDLDQRLADTFGYSNSIRSYDSAGIGDLDLNLMINPNLDAGCPVLLGIRRDGGGHAVVCDGYGYDLSTLYHHLNMGWGGFHDAWYNLPNVDASQYTYDTVSSIIYNVFVEGEGEIISGRLTDDEGNPISGALVTGACSGADPYTDFTDANGIYALSKVLPDSSYTLTASKTGYTFESVSCETESSSYWSIGNAWGVDITGTEESAPAPSDPAPLAPIIQLLLN